MTSPSQVWLPVAPDARYRFPGLGVLCATARAGPAPELTRQVQARWEGLYERWHDRRSEDVTSHPLLAAYREFAQGLGLDPDRQPPSVQMLIERGLRGRPHGQWPRINPIVDAVNAVAVQTMVALGAFDADRLAAGVRVALTDGGEPFQPLGTKREAPLAAGELVLRDDARVLSLFARRDGAFQAITPSTQRVSILACVVPGVSHAEASAALEAAVALLGARGSGAVRA